MVIKIDRKAIAYNINKAERITRGVPVSIMLKGFYDYLADIECVNTRKLYSQSIPNSVCYALHSAGSLHTGAVVADFDDFVECYRDRGIKEFYIPFNALDDREGLDERRCKRLALRIRKAFDDVKLYMMITSGCLNDKHPGLNHIEDKWRVWASAFFNGVSLGGSFYLSELESYISATERRVYCESGAVIDVHLADPPRFITDVRIGEYALFGTIPFCNQKHLFGHNAITVESEVIGVYPDRRQIVVRGGYSEIDTDKCTLLSGGLTFSDVSSEYTIYNDPFLRYKICDKVEVVPDYKSLVKLQYVAREYTE